MKMKLLTFLISSILSAHTFGAFTWVLKKSEPELKLWKDLKTNSRVTKIISKSNTTEEITLAEVNSIDKEKAGTLLQLGINDWKRNKASLVKIKNGQKLTFDGTYTDRKGQKIYFQELHFYIKGKVTQILYTQPYAINTPKDLVNYLEKEFFK